MDPDRILLAIASGKLVTKEELNDVARRLEWLINTDPDSGVSIDNAYPLLLVLGKAKAFEYKNLLEKYLSVNDPTTVSLVLEIVSLEWQRTGDYLERIINLALGASWDYDDDVREMALKILGEYLHARLYNTDEEVDNVNSASEIQEDLKSVIGLLLRTLDDENVSKWVRKRAYFSLMRVRGKSWDDIPSEYAVFDIKSDTDSEVINYCRNLAAVNSSSSSSAPSSASCSSEVTGVVTGIR